jgi:hypothetical protein
MPGSVSAQLRVCVSELSLSRITDYMQSSQTNYSVILFWNESVQYRLMDLEKEMCVCMRVCINFCIYACAMHIYEACVLIVSINIHLCVCIQIS